MSIDTLSKTPSTEEKKYIPVHLDYIQLDAEIQQDLYIHLHAQFILYKRAGQRLNLSDRKHLDSTNTKVLYLHSGSEDDDMRSFFEANLHTIVDNPRISPKEKSEVLYKCALGIAKDVFEKPFRKETVERSKKVVDNTIQLLADGSDAFVQMIQLSGHDYYTYTHSVNVLTFTITLLSNMGFKDRRFLKEAGMGALLHDVGKSKVPVEVLNKPGKLTEDEWNIMKQHPQLGAEIVENARLPERGVEVIVQHHERINGKGYPHGLYGTAIPIASQAVSLADAYDAMTTNRVYQKARSPFDALKIITQDMLGHYNPSMVQIFIEMLNLKKN